MDDQRRRDVALALLTVLAIVLAAVAAAPMFGEGGGGGSSSEPVTVDQESSNDSTTLGDVPRNLWSALVGILFSIWEIIALVILWILSFLEPLDLDPAEEGDSSEVVPIENRSEEEPGVLDGGGDPVEGADAPFALPLDEPIVLLLIAAGILLVVVVTVRYDAIQSVARLIGMDGRNDSLADLDGIGRVAGEAADRVEAADSPEAAENAIYRAWSEMVDLLDAPSPQSDTPRRFADAAIEAGMDPADVRALTGAFEEVRYGGAVPSEERRQRASDAFRRIEAAYGEEESSAESGDETVDGDPEGSG